MPPPHHEPVVSPKDPIPKGYIFVSKGFPYITRHCRSRTQARSKTVYVVRSSTSEILGIRVPESIYHSVLKDERQTRESRRANVQRCDARLAEQLQAAILNQFPRIPEDDLRKVARHALRKRSGRVGRAGGLEGEESARLAVGAWVRHRYTQYEKLLKGGIGREEARRRTKPEFERVLCRWTGVRESEDSQKLLRRKQASKRSVDSVVNSGGTHAKPRHSTEEKGLKDEPIELLSDSPDPTADSDTDVYEVMQPVVTRSRARVNASISMAPKSKSNSRRNRKRRRRKENGHARQPVE